MIVYTRYLFFFKTKPNRKRESDTVSEYGSTYSEEQISAKSKSSNSWLSILTPEVSSLMFSTFAMTLVSETLFALYVYSTDHP